MCRIRYVVTDNGGNTVESRRAVRVQDTTPPVITITGDLVVNHEAATEYKDEGAKAVDQCDGPLVVKATDGHVANVNTNNKNHGGNYVITYTVKDRQGLTTTVVRKVNVVDTTMPIITRNGDAVLTYEAHPTAKYTDLGAKASDTVDGDITKLITTKNTVDFSDPNTYTVTYDVVDGAGLRAAQVTRRVVVQDTTKPVIVLKGDASITIEAGNPYVEAGFTATDTLLGDITGRVTIEYVHKRVEQLPYNTTLYPLGENGVEKFGPITPISANGTATYYEINVPFIDTLSPADSVYYVDYTVTDDDENTITVRRNVTITDTTKPFLSISEPIDNMVVEAVTVYIEPGYFANDTLDHDITDHVVITGPFVQGEDGNQTQITFEQLPLQKVDTVMKIKYDIADEAGNKGAGLVRTVLILDTTAPVTAINGVDQIRHEGATTFTDPWIVSNDTYDGDISKQAVLVITIPDRKGRKTLVERVDVMAKAGSLYSLTYTSTDSSNNVGEIIRRTVEIIDTTSPVLTLMGGANVSWEAGVAFVDPGFTAIDTLDGDITTKVDVTVVDGEGNQAFVVDTDGSVGDTFEVTYTSRDLAGNTVMAVRRVVLVDTQPPQIKLIGAKEVEQEVGTPYVDAGVIASDSAAGLITNKVQVTAKSATSAQTCAAPLSKVATCIKTSVAVAGDVYEVVYTVKDADGRAASTSRTVTLVDTRPPVVVIKGALSYTITPSDADDFVLPECVCKEHTGTPAACANDLSDPTVLKKAGKVTVTFTCTDAANQAASKAVTIRTTNGASEPASKPDGTVNEKEKIPVTIKLDPKTSDAFKVSTTAAPASTVAPKQAVATIIEFELDAGDAADALPKVVANSGSSTFKASLTPNTVIEGTPGSAQVVKLLVMGAFTGEATSR